TRLLVRPILLLTGTRPSRPAAQPLFRFCLRLTYPPLQLPERCNWTPPSLTVVLLPFSRKTSSALASWVLPSPSGKTVSLFWIFTVGAATAVASGDGLRS